MDKILKSDFGILFWIHLFLILLVHVSWLFFSWWLIIIGAILLWIQYGLAKGCILTQAQIGKKEGRFAFIAYYIDKFNLGISKAKITFFVRHIMPLIIISLALIWQISFDKTPLIF